MRTSSRILTLQWLILFTALIACPLVLWAAESPPARAPLDIPSHFQVGLVLIVPSLIAVLKWIWPRVPKVALPFLAPLLGWSIDALAKLAGAEGAGPEWAVALGGLGVTVREMFNQSRKALNAGVDRLATMLLVSATLALSVLPAPAQFVVTPTQVQYVTNGARVTAQATYLLPPGRSYAAEQVDATGKRIRPAGLAMLTTQAGTVVNPAQIQVSTVKPDLVLFRVLDITGARQSKVDALRDIPLSVHPPTSTLAPVGTAAYKVSITSGVVSLTAERKFPEWLLLEEYRHNTWQQARWVALGGKGSVVIAQRYVGTGPAPTWRVSKWNHLPPAPPGVSFGVPVAADPGVRTTAEAGTEGRFNFTPAAAGAGVIDRQVITNGLFWLSCRQGPSTVLILQRAPLNGAGPVPPWTPFAGFACYPFAGYFVVTAPTNFSSFFVRGINEPCAPEFAPASAIVLGPAQRMETPFGNLSMAEVVGLQTEPGVLVYQVNP